MKHLEGKKFGKLFVASRSSELIYGRRGWLCHCDCGNKVIKSTSCLTSENTKSCGCLQSEMARQKRFDLTKTNTKKEAFESRYVVAKNGCWEWTGTKDKDGYGRLYWRGKQIRANRLSMELKTSYEVDKNLVVCHHCDNPSCVNPDHLFVGTIKENAQDALQKKRHYVGEKNGRSKLTTEQVKVVLSSGLNGQELANMFNVTRATINRIRRKEGWICN